MHGLGLTPITDADRDWFSANCSPMPLAVSASEYAPKSYHPKLTVKYQSRTNTCAGHAKSTGDELLNLQITGRQVVFSAIAAYLFAKTEFDGTDNDNGTSISSLFAGSMKHGRCRDELLPFREHFSRKLLTDAVRSEAAQHRDLKFIRVTGGYDQIRMLQLAGPGYFIFGGPWYENMTVENLGNGRETPAAYSGDFLGMHARVGTGWFSHDEMRKYGARDERPDLEVWNSHRDGPRPISATTIDRLANDQRCEIIHCSLAQEFVPPPVDWVRDLEVLT